MDTRRCLWRLGPITGSVRLSFSRLERIAQQLADVDVISRCLDRSVLRCVSDELSVHGVCVSANAGSWQNHSIHAHKQTTHADTMHACSLTPTGQLLMAKEWTTLQHLCCVVLRHTRSRSALSDQFPDANHPFRMLLRLDAIGSGS
jgi:hypothetical protein